MTERVLNRKTVALGAQHHERCINEMKTIQWGEFEADVEYGSDIAEAAIELHVMKKLRECVQKEVTNGVIDFYLCPCFIPIKSLTTYQEIFNCVNCVDSLVLSATICEKASRGEN